MAVDKLVDSTQLDTDLTAVANAIRTKGGTSAQLAFPTGFVDAIDAIQTGGGGMTIDQFVDHNYPQGAIETSATVIPAQTFRERKGITSLSAPNCTSLGGYVCYQCTELITVNFPKLKTFAASDVFDGCTKLLGFVGPELNGAPNVNNAFTRCTSFQYFDVGPNLYNLSTGNTFVNCTNLRTIVLRRTNGIVSISSSAFTGTPLASGGTGGTVYVPQALISSYQSATNWSTLYAAGSTTFAAIEGSQYENYYADGTPIT